MRSMQMQGAPNRLGELIDKRELRNVHVAAHCDVDQSTVYRWRVGETAIPDEQKLRLAAFFDVTVSFLMGWDDATNGKAAA